jgi:hypothetical protein
MFLHHPDVLLAQFHDRQRELIAEADRQRLLATVRRHNRQGVTAADASPAARGRPDGRLAECGPRAAAPAQ